MTRPGQTDRSIHGWPRLPPVRGSELVSARRRCRIASISFSWLKSFGFDSYWANDHPTRTADPWNVLTALAATTKRIRLVSLVSCVYYRNPVVLARQAADVDRLSQGRLVLGIGIGDDAREIGQLGGRFPSPAERHEALGESIEIVP